MEVANDSQDPAPLQDAHAPVPEEGQPERVMDKPTPAAAHEPVGDPPNPKMLEALNS